MIRQKIKLNSLRTICLFFAFIVIGCSKNQTLQQNVTPDVFTFYSVDLLEPKLFNDNVAKEITKKTNVILDLQYRNGEPSESIKLLIANGNYPDLIYAKSDLSRLIEEKAVIPLDDLIEKYGKNMKKLYGNEIVKLRYTPEDPSIYTVGTYEIKNHVIEISGNMQLQHAVLREFGYPTIRTLEDYENVMLAYKKQYPYINGNKTIGFSILADSWYWFVGLSNPGNYVLGYPDDGQWIVDQETMKAKYKFLHPEMPVFYKWLNKIYHEGLLDPESFTQTDDIWKEKIASGCVLGTSFAYWGLYDSQSILRKNDMNERTFAFLPVTIDETRKDPSLKDYGYSGGWGIAITKNCKDPVKAFKFLDWMCSEEAQILTNWGVEGEDYFYDGLKRRIPSRNISQSRGVGAWLYPFPMAGAGYIDSTGNAIGKTNRNTILINYSVSDKETLRAYGAEIWPDLFPSSQELGVSKHGQVWQYPLNSVMTEKINEADAFVKESLIKMIVGPEKDFDRSWKNMTEELIKMGLYEVEDEMTKLIATRMKLWEK